MKKIIFLFFLLFCRNLYSQNIGINNSNAIPHSSAGLDIDFQNKGFLLPRVVDTNAVIAPAEGLQIYDKSAHCMRSFDGVKWSGCIGLSTVPEGVIATLNCGNVSHSGNLFNGVVTNNVSFSIFYSGATFGTYPGITVNSNGVSGLIATLSPGIFNPTGSGVLVFNVSGTPSSTGIASFLINIGGQSCVVSRTIGNISSGGTAVVASWSSNSGCRVGAGTNNSPAGIRRGGVNQTLVQGNTATVSASISLQANVSIPGSYSISTNSVNGVVFAASGTFGTTGNQNVTLLPIGTPTNAGNYIWITNLIPNINVHGSVLSTNAPLGSSYTTHFNGIIAGAHNTTNNLDPTYFTLSSYTTGEPFSSNAFCQNKQISAQGCGGLTSVTASSGRTHPTVEINGQCWLKTNLITIPENYSNYTTTSWTTSSPNDQGYWGYYNVSTTNGSAGWQNAETSTNEGLLYQWCAAMDATISERSRGICPSGFHIPSDCEWMFLEHGLGMSIAMQNTNNNWRGHLSDNQGTTGYKLRMQGVGQTNASGFSGILSGYRHPNSPYAEKNNSGLWWTSSPSSVDYANRRGTTSVYSGVHRMENYKANGLSVRCLKD